MKIQSIHLKHILHFADLKVDFSYHDKPVTLILGDQASGKTSILRFSYQALTWFAARYKDLRSAGVVSFWVKSKYPGQSVVPAAKENPRAAEHVVRVLELKGDWKV